GCFSELIEKAKERYGRNVVILIDEYDKPILDNITDIEIAREMREGLKNLYSVIKDQDANIKFVFMTGVSKFSKVSIFSGLNNLNDITINKKYSSICGYTEEDLTRYFSEYLIDKDREQIRQWYNGYNWTGSERVYNPFSILNYLDQGEFKNYWFESGTPTFLIELLKKKKYYIPSLESIESGETLIGSFDIDFINPENLMFQAGYLTIESVKQGVAEIRYRISYPNLEVKKSLAEYIVNYYSFNESLTSGLRVRIEDALLNCKVDDIKDIMHSHFASIPADWYRKNDLENYEGYYASVFYSYFASLGLDVRCEDTTNYGKIDMAVVMKHAVFIFEFKVIGDNEEGTALRQIKEKGYADKYTALNVPVYLVGIEFDKGKRNITVFEWEEWGG
ncbi:MAG: ATP-binding protein, partial [Deferribacterales bacterium]